MGVGKSKEAHPTVDYKHGPKVSELGSTTAGVVVSKALIDFGLGERPCPLKSAINDSFEITNTSNAKIKFSFESTFPKEFQINFSPAAGTIDKGKSKVVKVKVIVNIKLNINHRVTLKIDEETNSFITVRIRCETGVFGVDPQGLEMAIDDGAEVPAILVSMKRSIVDYGGLTQEGIFRLAGEQTEIKRIKDIMNKKEFTSSNDVNTIASLVKIWYRELPVPILNNLPAENIFYSGEINDCVNAFNTLPDLPKRLLDWLMNLLISVSENSGVNKMTPQNLAIVVAPNLYDVSTSNPMEGLVMSQKCVQFLLNILTHKIQQMNTAGA
eukprot:TRINITY_DN12299_c0_g1_i1.p1 TRINITY_DN12299_c0_g1~~TRINITY_DN12299_c0_g1_i1.p1  ORF type:complete len:326 (-),score=32.55 TRINITY_DN12299_c0_g1_i1:154-1131(-)